MHEKDIPMLCEDAPTWSQIPTMYICPVTNVLGQIPLIPCYMDGQKHPTVPYRFKKSELGGAIADSRQDNETGSRLYELNVWLWNYGRSLLRPISVAVTDKIVQKRMSKSRLKGAETKKRRREGSVLWCHWTWYVTSYLPKGRGGLHFANWLITEMSMTSYVTKWVHEIWRHIPCHMML